MSLKIVVFCAQLCLIKTALTQCLGPRPAMIADGLGKMGAPPGLFESALLLENFPMPTPGLSIVADGLVIEGLVSVSGSLPFLGTVAIEGVLPTEGQGSVVYGCGNGEVAIMEESRGAYGPGLVGPAVGPMAPVFGGPMSPGPFGPVIDPGMAAAANTAAMAAAANSAGQAAMMTSVGLGANAAGLAARARL